MIIMKKQTSDLEISPQYLVDESGKVTHVLLDIAIFEQLLDRLEDLYSSGKVKNDGFIDFDKIRKNLSAIYQ